jgi:hypothetical protein
MNRIVYNISIILTGLISFGFMMQSCSRDDLFSETQGHWVCPIPSSAQWW